jgi:hypothetical protein
MKARDGTETMEDRDVYVLIWCFDMIFLAIRGIDLRTYCLLGKDCTP